MKSNDLLLHCYFEKDGDEWLGFCLDYSLVTQASTLAAAADKLEEQMREYVHDATVGNDRQHAAYLLRRRAPLSYWAKFYFTLARQNMRHSKVSKLRKAVVEPMPLVPALCA